MQGGHWADDLRRGLDRLAVEGTIPAPFVADAALGWARNGGRPTYDATGGF